MISSISDKATAPRSPAPDETVGTPKKKLAEIEEGAYAARVRLGRLLIAFSVLGVLGVAVASFVYLAKISVPATEIAERLEYVRLAAKGSIAALVIAFCGKLASMGERMLVPPYVTNIAHVRALLGQRERAPSLFRRLRPVLGKLEKKLDE